MADGSDRSIHINLGRNHMTPEGEGGVAEGEHPEEEEDLEDRESRIRFTADI